MKTRVLFAVLLCLAIGLIVQWPGDVFSQEGTGTPQATPTASLPPPPNSRPTETPLPPTSLPPTMSQPTSLPPTTLPPPNSRPTITPLTPSSTPPVSGLTPTVMGITPTLPPATLPPTQDGWVLYNNDDPRLQYSATDWQVFDVPAATGGTLSGTNVDGATLTVQFEGTGIALLYSQGPEGGAFAIQFDGNPLDTASSFASEYTYAQRLEWIDLPVGLHTLTVTAGADALWVEAVAVQEVSTLGTMVSPTQTAAATILPTCVPGLPGVALKATPGTADSGSVEADCFTESSRNVAPHMALTGVTGPFNTRLAIQVDSDGLYNDGQFNMGAFPDATGGAGANSWDIIYSWPDGLGTSFSTVRVDNVDSVYGSSSGTFIQSPTDVDGTTNESIWQTGSIKVTQRLQIVANPATGEADLGKITYTVENTDISVSHQVGLRIMIDTEIKDEDGAPFRVPGSGIITHETEFTGGNVPENFQVFRDVTEADFVASAILKSTGEIAPDRLVLADWLNIQGTVYDFTVDPSVDFTIDSAYAVYWDPTDLVPGESRTYVTYYGLGDVTADLQPPLALAVSGPSELSIVNGQYSPNPFEVVTTVFNNDPNTTAVDNVELTLDVPAGLTIQGDPTVSLGTLQPGQEVQQSWQVTAANSATPVTLEYSVTATGNNTLAKVVTRPISVPASTETLCTLTVKDPIDPSDVTQEAIDMMAYVDEANGLVIHSAPTINAVRGTSGSDAKMAAGVLKGYLAEGENAEVIGRVDFPLGSTDPDQIWYKIAYTDADGDPLGEGWIIGRLRDGTNDKNYVYEDPVDCSEDPAIKLDGTDMIPFYYDRWAATEYAIAQAYANNSSNAIPTQYRVTTSSVGPPYYDFEYPHQIDNATPEAGHTGSAPFISEMTWMGGFPTTNSFELDGITLKPCGANIHTEENKWRGWAYCIEGVNGNGIMVNQIATSAWVDHLEILGYFIQGNAGYPASGVQVPLSVNEGEETAWTSRRTRTLILDGEDYPYQNQGNLVFNTTRPKRRNPDVAPAIELDWYIDRGDVSSYVDLNKGLAYFDTRDEFYDNLISVSDPSLNTLADVKFGDYLFINSYAQNVSGSDRHGFFVVGWGEIKDCADVIGGPQLTLGVDLFDTIGNAPDEYVPYIADFPGSMTSTRQQIPIPRPFYCSAYDDPNVPGQDFFTTGHEWFFVTMPDQIVNLPISRIHGLP